MELLIGLISGAVGGNAAGGILKNLNLGVFGNSVAGIIGAGLGRQLMIAIGVNGAGTDLGAIISQIASGGIGGALVLTLVGIIRSVLVK